jgi:hypothetical protein
MDGLRSDSYLDTRGHEELASVAMFRDDLYVFGLTPGQNTRLTNGYCRRVPHAGWGPSRIQRRYSPRPLTKIVRHRSDELDTLTSVPANASFTKVCSPPN